MHFKIIFGIPLKLRSETHIQSLLGPGKTFGVSTWSPEFYISHKKFMGYLRYNWSPYARMSEGHQSTGSHSSRNICIDQSNWCNLVCKDDS